MYLLSSPRDRLIYLAQSSLVTRKFLFKVLKEDRECSRIFQCSKQEMIDFYRLHDKKAEALFIYLQQYDPKHPNLEKLKPYKIWTILDADFPPLLSNIPDPPIVLYGLGRSDYLTHSPSLAVVGTRNPSHLAKKHMYDLLKPLIDEDWLLVSGMANGIDGYSHRIADYYGGKTIAVLAGGLNHPYPPEHLELFQRLTTKQLVLSEYAPYTRPMRHQFPERNRLISGLSFATLVVEAKERSGSLITADQALEQGREVLAVPNAVSLEQAKGCHYLIQNGAKLIQNSRDIVQEWEASKQNWEQILVNKEHSL